MVLNRDNASRCVLTLTSGLPTTSLYVTIMCKNTPAVGSRLVSTNDVLDVYCVEG